MSSEILSNIVDISDSTDPEAYLHYDEEDGFSSSHELRLESNQKAWQVYFHEALHTYGYDKIEKVLHRYFQPYENPFCHVQPFTPEIVEKIEVGASYLTIEDLRKKALGQDLSKMEDEQIFDYMKAMNHRPYFGKKIEDIGTQPTEEDALYYYNLFLAEKEALQLFQPSEGMREKHAYEELMAKMIAPRLPREGTIFTVPVGGHDVCYFTVHKILVTGEGLVALAMKPITESGAKKHPPFLVFRAAQMYYTGLDALSTWVNNCEWNVGLSGYTSGKEKLQELMTDPEFRSPDQRIQVMGFSLGGVHAQRFVCDYVEDVEEAIFFNDLAIEEETADRFAEKVRAWPEDHPKVKFTVYRADEDHYAYFGDVHVGKGCNDHPAFDLDYVEIFSNIEFPPGGFLHTFRFFSQKDSCELKTFKGKEADEKLYCSRQSNFIRCMELLRKTLGVFVLYPIFWISRFISKNLIGRRVDDMLN